MYFGSRHTIRSASVFGMAGIAQQLTTSRYIHSPMNLNAFYRWAATASEEEIDEVMHVIYTVEHFAGDSDDDWSTQPVHPIVIRRPDLCVYWVMTQLNCQEDDCMRCETGQGGWQFHWIGPWTCPTIIGDEDTTTQELWIRARQCQCGRH